MLRQIKVLDAAGYRAALKEYNLTAGDYGGNVNAMDEITRSAFTQNYNVAVSGGNDNGKYRLSVGYMNQEGIIIESGFKKITANLASSFKFTESKRLGLDFNIIFGNTLTDQAPIGNTSGFQGSLIGQALQWNPTHPLRKPPWRRMRRVPRAVRAARRRPHPASSTRACPSGCGASIESVPKSAV
jgi:iron complex outermembrane receptor protein